MNWIDTLKNIFTKQTEDWTFGPLQAEQVPEEPKSQEVIPADEYYLSIDICSQRITNVRKFTSKFYGVVNSFIQLNHLRGDVASFQTVTTPDALKNIDAKRLDRVIPVNIPVLGPVPYRGGNITISLGLFSIKESDLAGPYLDLLQNLAGKAGIAVVNAALPFVDTIKNGVDAIIGNNETSSLEIGIYTTLQDPPKTGWFVVMRAPKNSSLFPELRVSEGDFKLIDNRTNEAVTDYPYLLYRIRKSSQRNDWYMLPEVKEAYSQLQQAVKEKSYTDARDLLKNFKRVTLTSNDLLFTDAQRISKMVEERTNAILETIQVASVVEFDLPDLRSYDIYSIREL